MGDEHAAWAGQPLWRPWRAASVHSAGGKPPAMPEDQRRGGGAATGDRAIGEAQGHRRWRDPRQRHVGVGPSWASAAAARRHLDLDEVG